MKKRKRRGLGGESEITELSLFMDNDQPIHRQLHSINTNQAKKACKGVWDVHKSAKLFQYAVDEAARKYGQEFGSGRSLKTAPFSITDRKQLALDLANDFKAKYNRCVRDDKWCGEFTAETTKVIKSCKLGAKPLSGLRRRRRK